MARGDGQRPGDGDGAWRVVMADGQRPGDGDGDCFVLCPNLWPFGFGAVRQGGLPCLWPAFVVA